MGVMKGRTRRKQEIQDLKIVEKTWLMITMKD